MSTTPLLTVRNLSVSVPDRGGQRTITTGIDLDLARGEAIAIVGESGSGKSLTARAIACLLPRQIAASGSVQFDELDLMRLTERELRSVRGHRIAMLLQDPFTMLNPLMRAGSVVDEMLPDQLRQRASRRQERRRRLAEVGLDDDVVQRMPFQLSGGMCQRVAIAAALARDPELLIADEPSTALDATTQADVVKLLHRLQTERGMSMILVTHDLRLAFATCRRVYVLYAGSLMEVGHTETLEADPHHPYTLGLLLSEPSAERRTVRMTFISGSVPQAGDVIDRCAFADRCDWAIEICRERKPDLMSAGPGRLSACVRWRELRPQMRQLRGQSRAAVTAPRLRPASQQPLVSVRNLTKTFVMRRGRTVRALRGVSIDVYPAESVGLIGESGAGKTTLGRCLIGLHRSTDGAIDIAGIPATDFAALSADQRSLVRRQIQMIFQNPYATLNPRHSVRRILTEALRAAGTPATEIAARVRALLGEVEIPQTYADRRPLSLSGGERQRVAIARALAVRPRVLVCDEPSASLDISVQAQVLNLFRRLQQTDGMSFLFITHNPAVARQMTDRIYVMRDGEVVEHGLTEDVFTSPKHPYTRRLIWSSTGGR
jgi:peptide/nickel transport system ATP-binding protein